MKTFKKRAAERRLLRHLRMFYASVSRYTIVKYYSAGEKKSCVNIFRGLSALIAYARHLQNKDDMKETFDEMSSEVCGFGARDVTLTFDDGPDPIWTLRMLVALRDARATATFFVIAPLAVRYPELIEAALYGGHTIEFHCVRHIRHTELSREEIEEDARSGLEMLGRMGVRPRFWRPPWGIITPWTEEAATEVGLEISLWNVDTHDWRGDPAQSMSKTIDSLLGAGSVILMHDSIGPGARREDCKQTVDLIPLLTRRIRERGLECSTLRRPLTRIPEGVSD